ncbi:acetyl esterase/lipase [Kribbella voronezhensis]|uniref:Acetyl esterase/lipase n=1 Tax=Kribbella voronezhensis TaxID=2512212 RepID=A0A4R7T4L7_9ACTN|nr:alpha/beta hydrolase [Kribbella voronezhensis]TDU86760.1 acetyl esterase/lipase [Kribbella voronezhensis]
MSHEQRAMIIELMHNAPQSEDRTTAGQRTSFDSQFKDPELGEGVTLRPTTLGGVEAIDIAVEGSDRPGLILYLHGGGYVVGSANTGTFLATALARRVGTPAVSLDYRLAPEAPFPAAVDDAYAAYRALLDGGTRASDIVLAGDSAGGGLVLAVLLSARRDGLPQPAGAVLFSPWTDLSLSGASMDARAQLDPIFDRDQVQWYADQYLAGRDPLHELVSPAFADLTGLPPLLIQVGSYEVLLDDSVRLAARAAESEVDVSLEIVAGVPHVFQLLAGNLDEADEALDRAGQFLITRLDVERPAYEASRQAS